MGRQLTKQEQYERCLEAAKIVESWIQGQIAAGLDSESQMNFTAGILAEVIQRLPKIVSGMISEKAQKQKGATTKDHYFGRKVSGDLILENIVKGASNERVAMIMMSRSRCHEVTSAENTVLKKHDCKKKFKTKLDIANEYRQAGINLISKPPKTVYNINGIEYSSSKEACEAHNISYQTLYTRCKTKSKKGKYASWTMKKNP